MEGKHFIVFYVGDGSSRESCCVTSAVVVKAETKREAIVKRCNRYDSDYDAIEIDNTNYIP